MSETSAVVVDSLTECINVGVGKAADLMNTMLQSHVTLTAPEIRLLRVDELRADSFFRSEVDCAAVEMRYSGEIEGFVGLVFDTGSAGRLVDCLTGIHDLRDEDLDSLRAGALSEIGNILINSVLGTIANQLGVHLRFSVPYYRENRGSRLLEDMEVAERDMVLLTKASFVISELEITGDLALFFSFRSYGQLVAAIHSLVAE
jgi:chemotaxis protein CheC